MRGSARDTDVSFSAHASTACAGPCCAPALGAIRLCFSPPLCRRERAEGGYRTCSIARSRSEDYCRRVRYPAEGTPKGHASARRGRPTPCRQSSTTHARAWSADRALPGIGRDVAQVAQLPNGHAGAPPALPLRPAWKIAGRGKVAARGRAASPTKRG